MEIESKKNIFKYILAFGSAQGLGVLVNVIRNKLVALLLGPNGMGIMALYSSSIHFVESSAGMGLGNSGIKTVSQEMEENDEAKVKDSIKVLRSWVMLTALMGMAACFMLSWLLSTISFGDSSRTLHFMVLSPMVAMLLISSGELAILKATRHLKDVIKLSLWSVLLSLFISVPLFYFWKAHAIIFSLLLVALSQMIATMYFSYKSYKPQFALTKITLLKGYPMIKLGLAFVISAIITSGSEYLVRAYLNVNGGDRMVGLFNAGYTIAFTYAGMVFSAVDSEFFPRLSTLFGQDGNTQVISATIKRQIRVSLMVIVPMILLLIVLLPWIVPLLFSSKFEDTIPMAQVALVAMILRAAYLPLAYVPLAKGDSKRFMLIECASALFLYLCVVVCYNIWGLLGSGIGLTLAGALELITTALVVRFYYKIRIL